MALRHFIKREHAEPVTEHQGWSPFLTLQNEINRLFSETWNGHSLIKANNDLAAFSASMDIIEDEKQIKITLDLPGLDSKDVDISFEDQYLTIKGEKKEEREETKDSYVMRERSYGSFQRSVALPETADADKANASFSKGVLTVIVPKRELPKAKVKKLAIKNEE